MKDGGGAFPYSHDVREYFGNYGGSQVCLHQSDGMTLRDYFAGQALSGLFTLLTVSKQDDLLIAKACYDVADAMLTERDKSK